MREDMVGFIRLADKLSLWVGHCFSWCIMILILGVSYEVFVRYALHAPTTWAFDISYIMYGTLFMMCGAYTLSVDGHVRADMLFRRLSPARQGRLELVLYILFFSQACSHSSTLELFMQRKHGASLRSAFTVRQASRSIHSNH
jgi:TRAP-type mannitol/chloroaromatic compound transport system permease small subunit